MVMAVRPRVLDPLRPFRSAHYDSLLKMAEHRCFRNPADECWDEWQFCRSNRLIHVSQYCISCAAHYELQEREKEQSHETDAMHQRDYRERA